MRKTIALLCLGLTLTLSAGEKLIAKQGQLQLVEINSQEDGLVVDEQLWGSPTKPGDRDALLTAIANSLSYLNTPGAAEAYGNYPVPGVTIDRVRRSLIRFRELLLNSSSQEEFQAAFEGEFVLYQSVGNDDRGTVLFTGYFEPVYTASTTPTAEYRYPIYRKPANFDGWSKPHPTRVQLEGVDGLLGKESPLSGYELVWLRDRVEAFLIQVQGSARLELTNGGIMTVGYEGSTDYPYTSIGAELIKDGAIPREKLSLPVLIDHFRAHPELLNEYVSRNNRVIFFKETHGAPPTGSIGVPITAERSIATDKSLMPPGALALIRTRIPSVNEALEIESSLVSRYVLDQDTGSAIKGAGRVDIFMGTGKIAGDRAGVIKTTGQLYYLLLKN